MESYSVAFFLSGYFHSTYCFWHPCFWMYQKCIFYFCVLLFEYISIYSFFCWWTFEFSVLVILNKASISILMPTYLWTFLLGKECKGVYVFIRNCQIVFYRGGTILNSHWPCIRVSFSCFLFSPTFGGVWSLLIFSNSYRWEVVLHCGFVLHFLDS